MLCSDSCHIGRKSLGLSTNLLNQESFIHYWVSASGLMRRILLTATSYPRSESDWQSLFIREMIAGLARSKDVAVSYWGPAGPLPGSVDYLACESDRLFLQKLADRGGIAHLVRANRFAGFANGFNLITCTLFLRGLPHTNHVPHSRLRIIDWRWSISRSKAIYPFPLLTLKLALQKFPIPTIP